MKERGLLPGSALLSVVLVMATALACTRQQSHSRNTHTEGTVAQASPTPDPSPPPEAVAYKVGASMRVSTNNMFILYISIAPEDCTRDKMLALASQLNKDFPDESRIYAVFFDSETRMRNYDPAGGSYSISKELERGEYELDRVKGREYINFSSKRGNPVNEIKIALNNRNAPVKKGKD